MCSSLKRCIVPTLVQYIQTYICVMPANFDCLKADMASAHRQGVLTIQEYDRQQEDAAMTDEEKQARQAKADADQAAMWESIGNVGPCQIPLPLHSLV